VKVGVTEELRCTVWRIERLEEDGDFLWSGDGRCCGCGCGTVWVEKRIRGGRGSRE
jgi:hypothetical protein